MSFLSRLFGRKGSHAGPGDLEKRLETLEAEAETAAPVYVGTAFNRAGDVALRGNETARAVEYYGRAIDAFLQDGQREAARGVANKIIRVRPGAVRTLCTLTWLDLAARHSATALLHLRDYVEAAKAIDRTGLAASQVYEMARLIPESEFIGAAADALDVLDFSDLGEEVRGWVKSQGSPEAILDPVELADACLLAAVKSSQRGEKLIGDESDEEPGGDEPEEDSEKDSSTEGDEPVDEVPEKGADGDADEVEEDPGPVVDEADSESTEEEAVPEPVAEDEEAKVEPPEAVADEPEPEHVSEPDEPVGAGDEEPADDDAEPAPTDEEPTAPANEETDASDASDEGEASESSPVVTPGRAAEVEVAAEDAGQGKGGKKKKKKGKKRGKKKKKKR